MFKFFFKKNTWDIWENLFHVIVLNFITLAVLFGCATLCIGSFTFFPKSEIYGNIYFTITEIFACIMISIFVFAEGDNAFKIADFETPTFANYFKSFASVLKDAILFGLFTGILIAVAFVSIPFYYKLFLSNNNYLFLVFAVLILWFIIITFLALQWFLPVRSIMHNKFWKCVKKSYILFFDNLGFSIALFLVNVLNFALSVFFLCLAPGFHGMTITNVNALRLRLYKYDWLEVNPDLTFKEQRNVPWAELLEKDKKTFGPRTFKSFFQPWKQ